MTLTDNVQNLASCEAAASTVRLNPQSFPHPPRAGSGSPPATIENVEYLLSATGRTARFDVIKKRLEVRRSDGSTGSINELVSTALLNGINPNWLMTFADEIGLHDPINRIRDWMLSKPWDGINRLPDFYATVLATDEYPQELKETLLRRWMLATAVAGIKEGAVPVHGVLTLQGGQGVGKTRWVNRLLPEHLRADYIKLDHHLDGANKDSIIGCITHFIVEIGELDSSFKKDVARLKGFLTNECDKLRRPYGKGEMEYPRKTVFAATVNDERFLVDTTGNRRWWTIAVRGLHHNHDIDMQQLFAQLAVDIEGGEQHWLTETEARSLAEYNLRHRSVSAIVERIHEYIDLEKIGSEGGTAKTAIEVLGDIGIGNPSNMQCKECGAALRELYGPPKRHRGRDKWRVHERAMDNPYKKPGPNDEEY